MGVLVATLTLASLLTGLMAAHLWYRASKVNIQPFYVENGQMEPVDPLRSQSEWIVSLLRTGQEAGRLNRLAAIWTAVSVFSAALAANLPTIVGWFGS